MKNRRNHLKAHEIKDKTSVAYGIRVELSISHQYQCDRNGFR